MLEGSPPDPEVPSAPAEATPPADPAPLEPAGPEAEVTPAERTVPDTEAIWRNRVAGKDRAHNAEVAELRRQLEAAKQPPAEGSDSEDWKSKAEQAQAALDQEKRDRALDVRSVKYAAAAEALDPETLASMDEAKLAALNARLSDEEVPATPVITDTNLAPKRSAATPSTPREKSTEELENDLKKHESEFIDSMSG